MDDVQAGMILFCMGFHDLEMLSNMVLGDIFGNCC